MSVLGAASLRDRAGIEDFSTLVSTLNDADDKATTERKLPAGVVAELA